jgi:transcriptional regulator with XRE-family HTH domain
MTMASGGGSVVVRRQLGRKLHQLRLASGKKVTDVAEAGIASKAKMSRIEAGTTPVKMPDIRALCWLYGADTETTEALAALAPGTQQEDWWAPALPGWFGLYAGLESTAKRIRCFEPQFIHGLLQTEAYARAVFATDTTQPAEVIDQRVRFRLERQRRSMDGATIVMGEAALRLVVESPTVMDEQLARVRESGGDIRVLPFSAGAYPRGWTFALLDFEDDEDPSVAYLEGPGAARYVDDEHERAEWELVWRAVLDKSVPIKEWT